MQASSHKTFPYCYMQLWFIWRHDLRTWPQSDGMV